MWPGPPHGVVALVPQRDPAEHPVALDDPAVCATHLAGRHWVRLIQRVGQRRDPGREVRGRVDLVGGQQSEAVLVDAGAPLCVRFEPSGVQTCSGRDQLGHRRDHIDRHGPGAEPSRDRSAVHGGIAN